MSTHLNYKQVANVTRRTWDTEVYEKKAQARREATAAASHSHENSNNNNNKFAGDNDLTDRRVASSYPDGVVSADNLKEEFVPADKHAIGPEGSERAFLKARQHKVDLESKVGTSEIINAEAVAVSRTGILDNKEENRRRIIVGEGGNNGVVKTGVGWHCKICDCFLKDSLTYLDHINGRKHQRKLGYSMRVERSSKEQLLSKLSQLSKKKEEEEKEKDSLATLDYHAMISLKDEEARRRKEIRLQKRQEKKLKQARSEIEDNGNKIAADEDREREDHNDVDTEEVDAEVNPLLAQMMGFSGFGGQ